MRLTKLFKDFFDSEKASGLVLIACTVVSVCCANSSLQADYLALWQTPVAGHGLSQDRKSVV